METRSEELLGLRDKVQKFYGMPVGIEEKYPEMPSNNSKNLVVKSPTGKYMVEIEVYYSEGRWQIGGYPHTTANHYSEEFLEWTRVKFFIQYHKEFKKEIEVFKLENIFGELREKADKLKVLEEMPFTGTTILKRIQ